MAILSGRYGQVLYDPAGVTPAQITAIKAWNLSLKTDYDEVTAFGATNKVYVPDLPDVAGGFDGFWDSDELTLFQAVAVTTPGLLRLLPNRNEASFKFEGLAYMDADINASVDKPPTVKGTFMAADNWTIPA